MSAKRGLSAGPLPADADADDAAGGGRPALDPAGAASTCVVGRRGRRLRLNSRRFHAWDGCVSQRIPTRSSGNVIGRVRYDIDLLAPPAPAGRTIILLITQRQQC